MEGFEAAPNLQHMALHMGAYLVSHHRLEASGEQWGEAGDGHTQRDPEAGAAFAVPVQPAVEDLHREVGGVALFGNDEGFVIGDILEAASSMNGKLWEALEKLAGQT